MSALELQREDYQMIIGDHELKADRALELLQGYAAQYASTVRLYDLTADQDLAAAPTRSMP